MKRNSDRYKKFASSPDDEIADETSTTRLYAYDLVEVKAMCVDGKTKSDVIRELVRRALYQRRYRQATTDPAFREILRAFDDQIGVRLHHMEERLRRHMEADFDMLQSVFGYLYFAEFFNMENVKRALLYLTPEDVTDEQFTEEWDERFNAIREAATKNMLLEAEKRKKRLEAPGGGEEGD